MGHNTISAGGGIGGTVPLNTVTAGYLNAPIRVEEVRWIGVLDDVPTLIINSQFGEVRFYDVTIRDDQNDRENGLIGSVFVYEGQTVSFNSSINGVNLDFDFANGGGFINLNNGNEPAATESAKLGTVIRGGLLKAFDTEGPQFFDGSDADDTVEVTSKQGGSFWGWLGADLFVGFDGDDFAEGGAGNDTLKGEFGQDTLSGGNGHDSVVGGWDEDEVYGGRGNDTLEGSAGADTLYGDQGDDELFGGPDQDVLFGWKGIDSLFGGPGRDFLYGQQGNDCLVGGEGADELSGERGDDRILAGNHDDTLFGGLGADTLDGEGGHDTLFAGPGADRLRGGDDNDELWGDFGRDTLDGGRGNDTSYGENGDDRIVAGRGHDRLIGGNGKDTLLGGRGNDRLFAGSESDLERQQSSIDSTESDGGHLIDGGKGRDVLWSVTSAIEGDILIGGDGTDTFYINDGDIVRDFEDGEVAFVINDRPHEGFAVLPNPLGGATVEFAQQSGDAFLFAERLSFENVDFQNLLVQASSDFSSAKITHVPRLPAQGRTVAETFGDEFARLGVNARNEFNKYVIDKGEDALYRTVVKQAVSSEVLLDVLSKKFGASNVAKILTKEMAGIIGDLAPVIIRAARGDFDDLSSQEVIDEFAKAAALASLVAVPALAGTPVLLIGGAVMATELLIDAYIEASDIAMQREIQDALSDRVPDTAVDFEVGAGLSLPDTSEDTFSFL